MLHLIGECDRPHSLLLDKEEEGDKLRDSSWFNPYKKIQSIAFLSACSLTLRNLPPPPLLSLRVLSIWFRCDLLQLSTRPYVLLHVELASALLMRTLLIY